MSRSVIIGVGVLVLLAAIGFAVMRGRQAGESSIAAVWPIGHGGWDVNEKPDVLDPKVTILKAAETVSAEGNGADGNFQVTATCIEGGTELEIKYLSDGKDNIGYKITGREFDFRIALDGNVSPAFTHPGFTNVIDLPMTDGLFGFMPPNDLYRAKSVKFELPLNNGATPILEIRPQDGAFQDFVRRCKAKYSNDQQKQEASSEPTPSTSEPGPDVETLKATEGLLRDKCRSGDPAEAASACDAQITTIRKLNGLGWCYGKQGQGSADYQWHECEASSLRQ